MGEHNVAKEVNDMEESFKFCPRFDKHELSDDQIEEIAERAAEKAVTKAKDLMYQEVGRGVVSKLWILIGFISVLVYLGAKYLGLVK